MNKRLNMKEKYNNQNYEIGELKYENRNSNENIQIKWININLEKYDNCYTTDKNFRFEYKHNYKNNNENDKD